MEEASEHWMVECYKEWIVWRHLVEGKFKDDYRYLCFVRQSSCAHREKGYLLWRAYQCGPACSHHIITLSAVCSVQHSTVGKIVIETTAMITTHLLPRFVQIPKGEQLNKIIHDFESERGFPQAVGAID